MGNTSGFTKKFAPDRILTLSLRTLRLLGGLPYTWPRYGNQGLVGNPCAEAVTQAQAKDAWSDRVRRAKVRHLPAKMVRSKLLVTWSWGLLLAVVVIVLNNVVFFIMHPNAFTSERASSTNRTIASALQYLQSAAVVALLTHLIFRGADLAGLAGRLVILLDQARPSWEFLGDKALCVVTVSLFINIVFDAAVLIVVVVSAITWKLETVTSVTAALTYFLIIILDAVIAAVIVLFYSMCSVLSFVYKETTARIKPVGTELHPSSTLNVGLRNSPVDSERIISAAQLVFELQNFQRVFNNYISLPIIFILLKSMMFLTVQVYDLSMTVSFEAGIVLVTILREMIYLVVLCCAPEEINEQVFKQLDGDYIYNEWFSF